MPSPSIAPGARVKIRGSEWVVKRVEQSGSDGRVIHATGISELVRHKTASFLERLESKNIIVLDPAETKLVPDRSPQFRDTRLFLESLLRQSPVVGNALWLGHTAAVDDLPYQLDPARQALEQPRQRILIADAVGLGKTIEIGILLSELMIRGRARRILVVTTRSMMPQFQKELWSRFTIPLVRLDSVGIARIQTQITSNSNPFHYYDKTIISIDTLKQDNQFRSWLEKSYWDVIVIDEAHNAAARGGAKSLRNKVAALLADHSDSLIMASATPHDGKAGSFASLMNMLNPTAIADPEKYGPDDIKGLFLRRFKKDIHQQLASSLKERIVIRDAVDASAAEEHAFDILSGTKFRSFDGNRRTGQLLFRIVLEKALFSSPAAARHTIKERLKKITSKDTPEASADREQLQLLDASFAAIDAGHFTKYRRLVEILRPGGALRWDPNNPEDRLVIFTERLETLEFLRQNLARDLNLTKEQVAAVHGSGISEDDLTTIVEDFGQRQSPIRLLLATDIASEGLNLHYLCHKLIHFDVPWSLMVFQQRNGRIDRYGQERIPQIVYLMTTSANEDIRGDLRILELLTQKDEEATKNIGDPSIFYGVFDASQEELITAAAIQDKLTPAAFEQKMKQTTAADLLTFLQGGAPVPSGAEARQSCRKLPRLFPDDFAFTEEALTALEKRESLQAESNKADKLLTVTVGKELRRVFKVLPPDAIPNDGRLHLTTNRTMVKDAIKRARSAQKGQSRWPDVHLLWDLHPFLEWLNFQLLLNFKRNEAPVMRLAGNLSESESIFLFQGEISNQQGQPVIHEWFAVSFKGAAIQEILSLDDLLKRTKLDSKIYPNPGDLSVSARIENNLADAVDAGHKHLENRRTAYLAEYKERLNLERTRLSALQDRQLDFLDQLFADAGLVGANRQRKLSKQQNIAKTFKSHLDWIERTLTLSSDAYLRVLAVFVG